MNKSISELDAADQIGQDDILLVSQKTANGYTSKKVLASNFKGAAGESGLPAIAAFKAEQTQINANLQTSINSVSGGYFKAFGTLADLNAATGMTTGQVAKVMSDPVSDNNGDYYYNGSTWVKGYDALTAANAYTDTAKNDIKLTIADITQTVFDSLTINKLNPSNLLVGYEVHAITGLAEEQNSVTTNLIDVQNQQVITVSGLQDNSPFQRFYHFLDKSMTVIVVANIDFATEKTIAVPKGAYWFRISLKQRNPAKLDISKAQIEYADKKSVWVDFVRGEVIGLHGSSIKQNFDRVGYAANGKNLFDKSQIQVGYEVYADGTLMPQAQSVASDYINITGLSQITLSGLQNNPEFNRYIAFYDDTQNFVSFTTFSTNTATVVIPSNASFLRFSLLQRTSAVFVSAETVQVEAGSNATSYERYKKGIASINDTPIVLPTESKRSAAYGAKYLLFGDSITESSDVEKNIFTDTKYRSNWSVFAKHMLKMSDYKNYAKSGASFIEYSGQLTWQKISHQVQTAITNGETPDVIVLSCGTNDGVTSIGDYTTAMSKAIDLLDKSITAESMRWSLYQIRKNFPNAVCFYCTQLQRADVETEERKTANDLMVRLAKRYGFNVIDTMSNSGIIKDFEVDKGAGRYLSDGLHPNVAGQQVQAKYIVSEIVARMTY